MSSLREVKDRIASVRSTLKITSAMKLVASSKLRRAQRAIENLRPYADTLSQILATASGATKAGIASEDRGRPWPPRRAYAPWGAAGGDIVSERWEGPAGCDRTDGACSDSAWKQTVGGMSEAKSIGGNISGEKPLVVVAFASNSSMCGAFNANVIKKTLEVARECEWNVEFWAFGRKMAEALRKEGHPATRDYSALVAHPSFDAVAKVAEELRTLQQAGAISGAVLVYNHFISTGRQLVVAESYLSADCCASPESAQEDFALLIPPTPDGAGPSHSRGHGRPRSPEPFPASAQQSAGDSDYILEPSAPELLETLMPQVLDLKLYAALLDSAASEHAARMIAMQTATDNAEELLASLTLEYNKGRQQKITSEILDLVGAEA